MKSAVLATSFARALMQANTTDWNALNIFSTFPCEFESPPARRVAEPPGVKTSRVFPLTAFRIRIPAVRKSVGKYPRSATSTRRSLTYRFTSSVPKIKRPQLPAGSQGPQTTNPREDVVRFIGREPIEFTPIIQGQNRDKVRTIDYAGDGDAESALILSAPSAGGGPSPRGVFFFSPPPPPPAGGGFWSR